MSGYRTLISVYTREEAEVMACTLRAHGIDSFLGNQHFASIFWHYTLALRGVQVMVPSDRTIEAREMLRTRYRDWQDEPCEEPARRHDRWKLWAAILVWATLTAVGFMYVLDAPQY